MRLMIGVLLLGCSSRSLYLPESETPIPDLLSSLPDLSLPDLSRPPAGDLGGFCGGTGIAGTCVQGFFAAFADCFQPAGSCVTNGAGGVARQHWCWSNGARILTSNNSPQRDWLFMSASGALCLTYTRKVEGDNMVADGTKITFGPQTGVYSCDNGTVVDTAGADCGGCDELCALLNVPPTGCSLGDCL